MEQTSSLVGWHPDPTGRYEFRYFNGQRWTTDVSVHGQRYVDPIDPNAPQAPWGASGTDAFKPGWAPLLTPSAPTRGMAVASFVVALVSFLIAWVPFVVVIGVGGAIAALVFGIIAIRRVRAGTGTGRGFAVAGIGLSVAAMALSSVGFYLTVRVLDEFGDFFDVGPNTARIVRCTTSDGLAQVDGTITNDDTTTHTYTITIHYLSRGNLVGSDDVTVRSVGPGDTETFHTTEFLEETPIECDIFAVNGPTPFVPES